MVEWKEMHQNFVECSWLQSLWEKNGFDYNQTKAWIEIGLSPRWDYDFAWWLANKKNKTSKNLNQNDIKELKKEYDNSLFDYSYLVHSDKERNYDVEGAQRIIAGWIKRGLTHQEVKQWMSVGLSFREHDFAGYLKHKGHSYLSVNLKELRKECNVAQTWLDWNYPKEERTNITTDLSVAYRGLEGSLKLDGFNNLKKLICYENRITSLDCSDCSSLEEIHCEDNLFINIKLTPSLRRVDVRNNSLTSLNFLNDLDSENLEWLNIHSNNFSESDLTPFSRFINLRELMLSNLEEEKIQQGIYNRFTGSLEPLKNLTRLNTLAIHNTDIGSGLEYLPDSIQYFYFSDAKQERKAGNIVKELRKYGKPNDGINFSNLLKLWKEANSEKIKIVRQQTEQLETQPAITPSSSKKSKKVKQKEKLTVTQEQIQQLQAELEAKKSKNVNLEKEHSFYKKFFDNYLQTKKNELNELKVKFTNEEQEWLDIYWEASQEIEKSSFVRKQLKRAEDNLKKKLGEEELKLILEKQAEINDLENQLNNLQIQEQILTNLSDQIPELENQVEIPPKQ